jgi:gluconolactonase
MERREFLKSAAVAGATMVFSKPSSAAAGVESKQVISATQELYPLGPDSKPQPGVPSGKLFDFSIHESKFFPGTQRTINVYIPAQYTADRPACVWIALDGISGTLPIVFDNLIHRKEMPVTIAIGLHPGVVQSSNSPQNPRFNRSFEFDSLTDILGEFILEELLPEVETQKTPDGLPILLSSDPNDRGISGGSTGGIGSFTTAWRNPAVFRRVYTMIGTFVGMRGGDRYPVLIRKTEPKPLRVFMQDGEKDGWPGGLELGDWWMSNQAVERALTFAGYEGNHAWGVLGHEGSHGESILPDVMRWLWKDWPKPVEAGETGNFAIQAIVKSGENWEGVGVNHSSLGAPVEVARASPVVRYASPPVVDRYSTAAAIASDRQGRVYVQNPSDGVIYRIGAAGKTEPFAKVSPGDNGIAFGPDGRLYVGETEKARILACNSEGNISVVAENIRGCRLTVAHNGNIYVTEALGSVTEDGASSPYSGKVWLVRPGGKKSIVAEGLNGPSGICLTPDGLWLCVAESKGHHAYSYQVQPYGELQYGEPFYWFHVPDSANDSGVTQVCMDRQGWAYAATRMGIQVFDRNGRVTAIFPLAEKQLAGICFGDADFQTLYVTTGSAIYRRRVKTVGMPSWEAPVVLPPWSQG